MGYRVPVGFFRKSKIKKTDPRVSQLSKFFVGIFTRKIPKIKISKEFGKITWTPTFPKGR